MLLSASTNKTLIFFHIVINVIITNFIDHDIIHGSMLDCGPDVLFVEFCVWFILDVTEQLTFLKETVFLTVGV